MLLLLLKLSVHSNSTGKIEIKVVTNLVVNIPPNHQHLMARARFPTIQLSLVFSLSGYTNSIVLLTLVKLQAHQNTAHSKIAYCFVVFSKTPSPSKYSTLSVFIVRLYKFNCFVAFSKSPSPSIYGTLQNSILTTSLGIYLYNSVTILQALLSRLMSEFWHFPKKKYLLGCQFNVFNECMHIRSKPMCFFKAKKTRFFHIWTKIKSQLCL